MSSYISEMWLPKHHSNTPSSSADHDTEKLPNPSPTSGDAPDGGLAAWLVVLGAWCASFCTFGWINSIGVFQEYYQDELLKKYSSATISWIPSLQIFFIMGLGPFIGVIYDHYGPRQLLIFGTVIHVFGIMMASLGTEYYQILLAQGVCSAIGASAVFQAGITCIGGWFNEKRGAALGIVFTGSSIGGVIFPIMVSRLIREIGFGWAMRTCGFLMLFLLVIANLTIRTYQPPIPHKVTGAQLAKPFTEMQFVLVTLGVFCFSYGFFVPINYLPLQAINAGMDPNLAQYLLPILNAASMFGRLFSGFMSDRLGRYNMFIVVCYLSGIWILALWLASSSNAALISFAALFGFFSGAYLSLLIPLIMSISPLAEFGFRTGIVMLATAVAGLTTNPINGTILKGADGYQGLKIFCGIFCLVGTTFVLVARIRKTGWILLARV